MAKKYLAVRIQQGRETYYNTVLSVKELSEQTKVPYFVQETNEGYQRQPNEKRVKDAADYIRNGGTFPTSILINSRAPINYTPLPEAKIMGVDVGWIVVPDDVTFYIVDGQHRTLALDRLSDLEAFKDFQVPVVIANWSAEIEELKKFVDVNNNNKSIDTALTNELLAKRAEEIGDLKALMGMGHQQSMRSLKVVKVMDILDSDPHSFWFEKLKIVSPTADQKKDDPGIISRTSMATSLKPFIKMNDIETDPAKLAGVLINYWQAVGEVCPEARDNPKEYPYLSKTTGLYIMNMLLPDVMMKAKGNYAVEEFARLLRATSLTSKLWIKDGDLKGVGGQGGFTKIANLLRVGLSVAS